MMFLLNLPEAETTDFTRKLINLGDVIVRNSPPFRIVVYDALEPGGGSDEVKDLLKIVRTRRQYLSERFGEIQVPAALAASQASIDPRSPLYGIASLVYSHTINDTARTWLWVWKCSNGDMSGQPSLAEQP